MVTRRIPDPKIGGSIPSGVIFFWEERSSDIGMFLSFFFFFVREEKIDNGGI